MIDAASIVADNFEGIPKKEVLLSTSDHLKGTHIISAYDSTVLIGFTDFYYAPSENHLYISGIQVAKNSQNNGVATSIVTSAIELLKPKSISAVTSNPNVYSLISKLCANCIELGDLLPNNNGLKSSLILSNVPKITAPFDLNRYPKNGLYGINGRPQSSNNEYNAYFNALNLSDGLLVAGEM